MINGNDIICLSSALKKERARNFRFLEKLFTKEERQIIGQSSQPEMMIWILWSLKECAYKIDYQQTSIRKYTPLKYIVAPENINLDNYYSDHYPEVSDCSGIYDDKILKSRISTSSGKLYAVTIINKYLIYSLAYQQISGWKYLYWGFSGINTPERKTQSEAVRTLALNRMANILDINKNDVKLIGGKEKPPLVYIKEKKANISLSLSHDGHYIGYSFFINA